MFNTDNFFGRLIQISGDSKYIIDIYTKTDKDFIVGQVIIDMYSRKYITILYDHAIKRFERHFSPEVIEVEVRIGIDDFLKNYQTIL